LTTKYKSSRFSKPWRINKVKAILLKPIPVDYGIPHQGCIVVSIRGATNFSCS
jgi:hypothetical protein